MMTHCLPMLHGLSKNYNIAQELHHKKFLCLRCCSKVGTLRLTRTYSDTIVSIAGKEIHMKECPSVSRNSPAGFNSRKAHIGSRLNLSWLLHCAIPVQTFQHKQLTSFFLASRQNSLLLVRPQCGVLPNPSAPQLNRTFLTSSVIFTPNSPIQNKSTGHEADAITSPSAENVFASSATTATEAGVSPEVEEVANSLAESATSATLLFPDFPSVHAAEVSIQKLHDITGLPWWTTIALTAVVLRVALIMPLSVYALHNAEKLGRLQPEILEISKQLKQEISMAMHQFKWDEKKAKDEYIKNMKRLIRDIQIKHNCHPMKSTASFWLQLPVWISVSYSLRNMTSRALSPRLDGHEECLTLRDEGALWFPDLTSTDSTWILPALMGFVTLFNIEMTHLKIGEETKYRKRLTLFLRCLALFFVPISSTMPSAMVFYWVTSGFLAAGQNMLHDYSPFRRLVRLGQSPTESSSPVKALLNRAKLKYLS